MSICNLFGVSHTEGINQDSEENIWVQVGVWTRLHNEEHRNL
jgi:hypothetical protein